MTINRHGSGHGASICPPATGSAIPLADQKSEFAYHGQWVHNLWLDILNKVGLIPFVIAAGFTVTKHTLRLLHCRAYEALTLQLVVESDCKFEPWSHVDLYAGARSLTQIHIFSLRF